MDDIDVPVISLEKLIKNKLSTGREKDRIDAKILQDKKASTGDV